MSRAAGLIPGAVLPPIRTELLTRHDLALYCGASGDHNPLHTDSDFARARGGLEDVIGHGMRAMALAGRLLSAAAPPEALRAFSVRFSGKVQIGDVLIASGTVEPRSDEGPEACVVIRLKIETADGRGILTGTATIAV